ncbi:MAG: hypothetical protein ACRCX2_10500 [Paraclostridium sp.]
MTASPYAYLYGIGAFLSNYEYGMAAAPDGTRAVLSDGSVMESCLIQVRRVVAPLPNKVAYDIHCGSQPSVINFDRVSCSSKLFRMHHISGAIAQAQGVCESTCSGLGSLGTFVKDILSDVSSNGIPRSLPMMLADGLYSDVQVCDGSGVNTQNFLTYSANSLLTAANLDVHTAGFTYDIVDSLLSEYEGMTEMSAGTVVAIMDFKNYEAFRLSYIAKVGNAAATCCLQEMLGGRVPTTGIGNNFRKYRIHPFVMNSGTNLVIILDNKFPFARDDQGYPYIPFFVPGVIGMRMRPTFKPVNYGSISPKELSSYAVARYGNGLFSYGLRAAKDPIDRTPGIYINYTASYGVVKFHDHGQFFVKGMK